MTNDIEDQAQNLYQHLERLLGELSALADMKNYVRDRVAEISQQLPALKVEYDRLQALEADDTLQRITGQQP